MKKSLGALAAVLIISSVAFSQNNEGDRILGVWLSEEKDGKIEIYRSGNRYFGKLVWGEDIYEADGKTSKKDVENPDKKLRSRNLKDLVILTGFVYDDGEWNNGEIYDPQTGNTYSCVLKLKDNNTLDLRGYIGISLFGRTTVWQRIEQSMSE